MNAEDEFALACQGWQTYSQELLALRHNLDADIWQQLLTLITGCKGKIAVSGVGTSGIAARKIAHMLACVEQPAVYLSATDAAHGDLGFMRSDDLMILISRGGNSEELTRLLPALKARGVAIISVTENTDSAIARAATLVVKTHIEQEIDPLNMLATTSIILVLAVFDALCGNIMLRNGFDQQRLLKVHPGGNVGKILREQDV
ncbi:SIS domain-containing protein [Rahnella sp. C60]|uniref:SIS domain-containing protein n=1 Tax=Rahnella perminowiae TaxID=2816244 RepID=A0ABS6KV09_9GAMM|nr:MULTISPECIES: SIS domain-containing protein [Rahnella]UJD88801.1 SIS domain-containing protein [Rahnella aquatilis]MBU9809531.1 SIS domain-containing protein [Rahnella perminowiae]MBU9815106.1 SIS domain-containing protein [Rahnella perminowiae]MBU9833427.1 SIS domain-containing protein [Rahnella perminowiae]MCR9002068.1 SIS domain-containing protein [Rahnella perminowiae]